MEFILTTPPLPKKNTPGISQRKDGTPYLYRRYETRKAEEAIRKELWAQMGSRKPIYGPVRVSFLIRKTKADLLNLAEMLSDGLQGVVIGNDRQIVEATIRWSKDLAPPTSAVVIVEEN